MKNGDYRTWLSVKIRLEGMGLLLIGEEDNESMDMLNTASRYHAASSLIGGEDALAIDTNKMMSMYLSTTLYYLDLFASHITLLEATKGSNNSIEETIAVQITKEYNNYIADLSEDYSIMVM